MQLHQIILRGGEFNSSMPGCVCPKEKVMGPFWPQVSEMSEMVSLKMGVKFASSLIMGEKLPQKLYVIICRNAVSGHI